MSEISSVVIYDPVGVLNVPTESAFLTPNTHNNAKGGHIKWLATEDGGKLEGMYVY